MSTKDLDLRFRYRGGSPIVASEGCRLAEEERGILLEVLSRHFERSEPGAFTFDWFDPATLSPLQRFQRDGSGAQSEASQKMARELGVLLSTPDRPIGDLTEDEKRLVLIREVVGVLIREVRSMSREGVPTRLAATHPDRPALVDHFLSLDLAHPSSPFDAMSAAGESLRKTMREDLGREPTHEEWHSEMYQIYVCGKSPPMPITRPATIVPAVAAGQGSKSAWITSPKEKVVLQVLRSLPPGEGMTGPQIVDALSKLDPPVDLDTSVLTRHIIPSLKTHAGVENQPGRGYFIARA